MSDDILKRLAALEAENAKLKAQVGLQSAASKPTTTYIAQWKGFPVLRFEGNFRPFGIGLKKAALILERLDEVRFFVDNNKQRIGEAPLEDADESSAPPHS